MKALSIRQPWAWLIVNGHKDIENRSWPTRYRGEFLVHAGKGCTQREYYEAREFAASLNVWMPELEDLPRGGIVGKANIVGCVESSSSPWFFGDYGFQLTNAEPLDFVSCKGRLGFFNVNIEANQ